MDPVEVAVVGESTGQLWTSSVWDVRTGTALMTYRGGGVAAPKSVCLVGEDYLASTERTKPLMHVWPLNSQERLRGGGLRLVLPGVASCAAFSPDGATALVAVDEKLYAWSAAGGGGPTAALEGHYQRINRIAFTDDGSHFVTAADDGFVIVRSALEATSADADAGAALYTFSDHSLPVKDVHVGRGGLRCRLATASADRTCKVYDLSTGEMILNVSFDKSLSAVTMDSTETKLFVGTLDGDVYSWDMTAPPRNRDHFSLDTDKAATLSGHTDAVTCLSCSLDNETLISGSNDGSLIVWHVPSAQKLHAIPLKGAVTNAFFAAVPRNMFADEFEPTIAFGGLERSRRPEDDVEVYTREAPKRFWKISAKDDARHDDEAEATTTRPDYSETKDELDKLKAINANLYKFAIESLFERVDSG